MVFSITPCPVVILAKIDTRNDRTRLSWNCYLSGVLCNSSVKKTTMGFVWPIEQLHFWYQPFDLECIRQQWRLVLLEDIIMYKCVSFYFFHLFKNYYGTATCMRPKTVSTTFLNIQELNQCNRLILLSIKIRCHRKL